MKVPIEDTELRKQQESRRRTLTLDKTTPVRTIDNTVDQIKSASADGLVDGLVKEYIHIVFLRN